ncbi:MAG: hypothetical protein ACKOX3_09360 [Bacteroidota bacterium]
MRKIINILLRSRDKNTYFVLINHITGKNMQKLILICGFILTVTCIFSCKPREKCPAYGQQNTTTTQRPA